MQFLFVRTNHAVWLTLVLTSRLATLPLALLQDVTPAHRGLSPFGLFKSMNYIYHSRHTHAVYFIAEIVLKSTSAARFKLYRGLTVTCSEVGNKNIPPTVVVHLR